MPGKFIEKNCIIIIINKVWANETLFNIEHYIETHTLTLRHHTCIIIFMSMIALVNYINKEACICNVYPYKLYSEHSYRIS